jgi:hypothetical protein
MRDTFGELEPLIKRITKEAKAMGMTLSIVSRTLILQGGGALVIMPMPRTRATWNRLTNWQLYEVLYSRSYRRRSADYGEEKEPIPKFSTRKEIYAKWDKI